MTKKARARGFGYQFLATLSVLAAGSFCTDAAVAGPLIENKQNHVDTKASSGKIYRYKRLASGNVEIFSKAFANCRKKTCKVDFVITANGQLLLGNKHTYMTGGDPVRAAGELVLKQERNEKGLHVTQVTNGSGHYKPSKAECSTFGGMLLNLGIGLPRKEKDYLRCR